VRCKNSFAIDIQKMKNITKACWSIKLLITILFVRPVFAQTLTENKKVEACISETEFKNNMSKLSEDHIMWTRNNVLCLVDDMPGKDESIKRLMKNQVEIGLIMKQFYGDKVGNDLAYLLKDHVSIFAELVTASDKGSREMINDATIRWYKNGDEIAELFCNINPYWKLEAMQVMIKNHLKLMNDLAVQRIVRNWAEEIVAYDKLHTDILKIADMLSEGIIKQFPEKFDTGIMYSDKK